MESSCGWSEISLSNFVEIGNALGHCGCDLAQLDMHRLRLLILWGPAVESSKQFDILHPLPGILDFF